MCCARTSRLILPAVAVALMLAEPTTRAGEHPDEGVVRYRGDGSDLQGVLDAAAPRSTVLCDAEKRLELSTPIILGKPITLVGLHAGLPRNLGKTSLIVVTAEGVAISDVRLHGNYDSVPQSDRAPLISVLAGDFRIERCACFDASKDGIEVTARGNGRDLVGGLIRDIVGHRIARDVVSLSGSGGDGCRIRNVTIENVRLQRGFLRGAVEVSDGSDNIVVRNIHALQAVYAVDVQDHGHAKQANTNVIVENVTAVDCNHVVRTANSEKGHANLVLRNLTSENCSLPVRVANTKNVTIENLVIRDANPRTSSPIVLKNCHNVTVKQVAIDNLCEGIPAAAFDQCTGVGEMPVSR